MVHVKDIRNYVFSFVSQKSQNTTWKSCDHVGCTLPGGEGANASTGFLWHGFWRVQSQSQEEEGTPKLAESTICFFVKSCRCCRFMLHVKWGICCENCKVIKCSDAGKFKESASHDTAWLFSIADTQIHDNSLVYFCTVLYAALFVGVPGLKTLTSAVSFLLSPLHWLYTAVQFNTVTNSAGEAWLVWFLVKIHMAGIAYTRYGTVWHTHTHRGCFRRVWQLESTGGGMWVERIGCVEAWGGDLLLRSSESYTVCVFWMTSVVYVSWSLLCDSVGRRKSMTVTTLQALPR